MARFILFAAHAKGKKAQNMLFLRAGEEVWRDMTHGRNQTNKKGIDSGGDRRRRRYELKESKWGLARRACYLPRPTTPTSYLYTRTCNIQYSHPDPDPHVIYTQT